jgi:hypothetical protein
LEALARYRRVADAFNECIGGLLIALSHCEVHNQLVMAFNRHEGVYIAGAIVILLSRRLVAFPDRYVTPDFIELKIRNRDINQQTAHELFALLARRYQEPQNRVPMQAGKPLGRPDAVSFQEHPKCRESIVNRRGHLAEGLRLFFCESPFAIDAAKAEATVAVYREPLACPLAGGAGHRGFVFCGSFHDYIIRKRLWNVKREAQKKQNYFGLDFKSRFRIHLRHGQKTTSARNARISSQNWPQGRSEGRTRQNGYHDAGTAQR